MLVKLCLALALLANLGEAQNVACNYSMVAFAGYTCTLISQNIQNEMDMAQIGGQHLPGMGDTDVTGLRQTGSTIQVFPSLIINRFVAMDSVLLSGTGMRLFNAPITNCNTLSSVSIFGAHISSMPQGIFRNCQEMVLLAISSPINFISLDAFVGLTNLRTLSLFGGNIPSFNYEVLRPLVRLESLFLGTRMVNYSVPLPNMPQLTQLSLDGNDFVTWNPELVGNNPQIRFLSLADNPITSLTSNAFVNLTELDFLNLSNLQLQVLPTFEGLGNLDTLFLTSNNLTTITAAPFRDMWNLIQLEVASNQIVTVNFRMTNPRTLQNLKILNLSSNRIENIDDLAFSMLSSLVQLNLIGNNLVRLNAKSLQPMIVHLSVLELGGNEINQIERELLHNVNNLTMRVFALPCVGNATDIFIGENFLNSTTTPLDGCFSFASKLQASLLMLLISLVISWEK